MEKTDVNLALVDDRTRLLMTTVVGGENRHQTYWSASDVDAFVSILAKLRADMRDEVPHTRDAGGGSTAPIDPVMTVARSEKAEDLILSVRHPGLGWVNWRSTPQHVKTFMFELLECLKRA